MDHRTAVRRIALARLVSVAGTEATFIALLAYTYQLTGSAYWASGVLMAWIGTAGIVAPFAGWLGDRFDRRRVMIASDLAAAVAFGALALAGEPWLLVVITCCAAAAESPFFPASRAAIPNLVPADQLTWANATITSGRTIGALAGPLIGGGLVAAVGAQFAFVGNIGTFLISALLVASVRGHRFSAERDPSDERGGLGAGFAFVWNDRVLRTITIAWFVFLAGVGVVLVAEFPLAESLGVGELGYGLMVSAWSAGALAGAELAKRIAGRDEIAVLAIACVVMSVAIGVVWGLPWFAAIVGAMIVGGVANGVSNVVEEVLVQRRTPDALRSRVFSASEAVVLVALASSFVAGGPLVEALGPRPTYLVTGLSGLVAAVVLASVLLSERAPAPRDAPAA